MGSIVEVVWHCPRSQCARLFIARYPNKAPGVHYGDPPMEFLPVPLPQLEIPTEVSALSPNFVSIYKQAASAESFGLDQLCGMGYRKALEFLVKDYCIKKTPEQSEPIRNTMLGPCIEKYVPDERVKQCARRAAWLGNDETHYVRRWEGKDITDLKALLKVTIAWIESDLLTDKYLAEMSPQTQT